MGDVIHEQARFAEGWKGGLPETPCGAGSTMWNTKEQRKLLPRLFRQYAITSVADVGAGDLNWIRHVPMDGIEYIPLDLMPRVPEVTAFDLVREVPPRVDLILCLWVLNHLPFADCRAALANLKASGSRWLLMTDRPMWHHEQPEEIQMAPIEELILNPKTGDRIILVKLNDPEPVEDAEGEE